MEIFRIGRAIPPSRTLLVATFLALLELARLSALHLYQGVDDEGAPVGPIRVRATEHETSDLSWHERITETM
jgi:chromatin segregation and condensation protein Rec8/ScpA/Scc1 (kleisin family)